MISDYSYQERMFDVATRMYQDGTMKWVEKQAEELSQLSPAEPSASEAFQDVGTEGENPLDPMTVLLS